MLNMPLQRIVDHTWTFFHAFIWMDSEVSCSSFDSRTEYVYRFTVASVVVIACFVLWLMGQYNVGQADFPSVCLCDYKHMNIWVVFGCLVYLLVSTCVQTFWDIWKFLTYKFLLIIFTYLRLYVFEVFGNFFFRKPIVFLEYNKLRQRYYYFQYVVSNDKLSSWSY